MSGRHILYIIMVLLFGLCLPSSLTAATEGTVATAALTRPVRAWHFVLNPVSMERARWMVDVAHTAGFNMVIVCISDGVALRQAPWRSRPEAWKPEEFKSWVAYARGKGMDVVPDLRLLTHQIKLFQNNFPDLMYNSDTYDPRNEKVYAKVLPLLDEIIEIVHPRAFHIGHDEVAGHSEKSAKKFLRQGESMLPADLFLKDVLRVHAYLRQRGIETWMWGDMLISPAEFPSMKPNSLHGATPGYGKALRDQLPRDIVICDWHYTDTQSDFPSLDALRKEGFRMLGATWKNKKNIRNFSRYAASHGAYGMIASTWFHVRSREWDVIETIIRTSGEAFRKDFPEGK